MGRMYDRFLLGFYSSSFSIYLAAGSALKIRKEWKCARLSCGVMLCHKTGWFHVSYLNLSFGELTSLPWNCSALSWCVCPRVGWSDMLAARLPWNSDQDPLSQIYIWLQPCRFEKFVLSPCLINFCFFLPIVNMRYC